MFNCLIVFQDLKRKRDNRVEQRVFERERERENVFDSGQIFH